MSNFAIIRNSDYAILKKMLEGKNLLWSEDSTSYLTAGLIEEVEDGCFALTDEGRRRIVEIRNWRDSFSWDHVTQATRNAAIAYVEAEHANNADVPERFKTPPDLELNAMMDVDVELIVGRTRSAAQARNFFYYGYHSNEVKDLTVKLLNSGWRPTVEQQSMLDQLLELKNAFSTSMHNSEIERKRDNLRASGTASEAAVEHGRAIGHALAAGADPVVLAADTAGVLPSFSAIDFSMAVGEIVGEIDAADAGGSCRAKASLRAYNIALLKHQEFHDALKRYHDMTGGK